MSSVLKVNVTDTFNFWREQFNALVDQVGVEKYFVTPMDFGATGNGTTDDTAAFDAANLQDKPVYIPPGSYFVTKQYDGTSKFFQFGGVIWSNGQAVTSCFKLDPTGSLIFRKPVEGVEPTSSVHLTTKNYVDTHIQAETNARTTTDTALINAIATEITNRTNADTNLQNQLNLKPVSGNWWNNGIVHVNADGGTEIGGYVDFHSQATAGADYDVRMRVGKFVNANYINFTENGSETNPALSIDVTHGALSVQDKTGTPGSWNFTLSSVGLTSVDAEMNNKVYMVSTMIDDHGGAKLRGFYHNGTGRNAPAFSIEGIKTDNGQNIGEWSAISVNGYSLSGGVLVPMHADNNVFGVYNDASVKLVVKGDGRVFAPGCTTSTITNSAGTILTTKDYVDSKVNYTPTSGNWWNNGLLYAKTDGGTEIGNHIDFHSTSESTNDYDIRFLTSKITESGRASLGLPVDRHTYYFTAQNAASVPNVGMFPSMESNLTDGEYIYKIGQPSAPSYVGGVVYQHAKAPNNTNFDWQNDGKAGFNGKQFLYIGLIDDTGGAKIQGHQRLDNSGHPALQFEAVRNDDGQNMGEAGAFNLMAFSFKRNLSTPAQPAHVDDNIFTVQNLGDNKIVLKGDGRLFAPSMTTSDITNSAGTILTTKDYVNAGDANLQTQLNLKPVSGNWWNNGLLRVGADGGTEVGYYIDYHCTTTGTSEYDVRMSAGVWGGSRFWGLSESTGGGQLFADVTAGNLQIVNNIGPGSEVLLLNSKKLTSVDSLFGTSQMFMSTSMIDDHGGARIRGHYHNGLNRAQPAFLLEGVRNDDGQTIGAWATVSVNAYSLQNISGNITGVGSNADDNIFGVFNNGSVRLIVKGDGRVFAPSMTTSVITNSAGTILATKDYADASPVARWINWHNPGTWAIEKYIPPLYTNTIPPVAIPNTGNPYGVSIGSEFPILAYQVNNNNFVTGWVHGTATFYVECGSSYGNHGDYFTTWIYVYLATGPANNLVVESTPCASFNGRQMNGNIGVGDDHTTQTYVSTIPFSYQQNDKVNGAGVPYTHIVVRGEITRISGDNNLFETQRCLINMTSGSI